MHHHAYLQLCQALCAAGAAEEVSGMHIELEIEHAQIGPTQPVRSHALTRLDNIWGSVPRTSSASNTC